MTVIAAHLNSKDLEASYEAAANPVAKRHFHALWLLSCGHEVDEVAELLSLSTRWVWQLIRRYNEGGPEQLGDQRSHNGTVPSILTPEALAAVQERLKTSPDDGGVWTAPKVAQFLAAFHQCQSASNIGSDSLLLQLCDLLKLFSMKNQHHGSKFSNRPTCPGRICG
jgi:transposase